MFIRERGTPYITHIVYNNSNSCVIIFAIIYAFFIDKLKSKVYLISG